MGGVDQDMNRKELQIFSVVVAPVAFGIVLTIIFLSGCGRDQSIPSIGQHHIDLPGDHELTVVYYPSGSIAELSLRDSRTDTLVAVELFHSNGVHRSITRLTPDARIQSVYSDSGRLVSEKIELRNTNVWERVIYLESGLPFERHTFSNGIAKTIYYGTNGLPLRSEE